jgi:hypothetical protein
MTTLNDTTMNMMEIIDSVKEVLNDQDYIDLCNGLKLIRDMPQLSYVPVIRSDTTPFYTVFYTKVSHIVQDNRLIFKTVEKSKLMRISRERMNVMRDRIINEGYYSMTGSRLNLIASSGVGESECECGESISLLEIYQSDSIRIWKITNA